MWRGLGDDVNQTILTDGHTDSQTDIYNSTGSLAGSSQELVIWPRSSVCMSVSKITKKTRAWIWMKCCVSTGVGTWTNWLTFEPNPPIRIIVRMLEPDCFICAATRNFITSGKCVLARPVAAARRGFKMVLFTASRRNTFVGGTYALSSAF